MEFNIGDVVRIVKKVTPGDGYVWTEQMSDMLNTTAVVEDRPYWTHNNLCKLNCLGRRGTGFVFNPGSLELETDPERLAEAVEALKTYPSSR